MGDLVRRHLLALALTVLAALGGGASARAGPGELDSPCPPPPSSADGVERAALFALNADAIATLRAETAREPWRTDWIAVVPGASEQWGHHKATPRRVEAQGVLVSEEFRKRLDRAYRLLEAGVVRFILVSGGAIDKARPDYVEALRGRDYLLATYGAGAGASGPLARRILVEPFATTSPANIHNADKLCLELGLERNLIVTTMPIDKMFLPYVVPLPILGQLSQGWYLLHHMLSDFDHRSRRLEGFAFGDFHWGSTRTLDDRRVTYLVHTKLSSQLARDSYSR